MSALFAEQSWRESEEASRRVFESFRSLHRVHELIQLLRTTETLRLPPEHEETRTRLLGSLEREPWTEASLKRFERGDDETQVLAFLRGLVSFTSSKRRLRVY